jgi:uncharacterized lipoprotein YehR (DUF1307 family)
MEQVPTIEFKNGFTVPHGIFERFDLTDPKEQEQLYVDMRPKRIRSVDETEGKSAKGTATITLDDNDQQQLRNIYTLVGKYIKDLYVPEKMRFLKV